MPSLQVSEIIRSLEERAPIGTAETWDNVGLLAGSPRWKTAGVVLSIDLTAEAIAVAKARKFRLIVNHHPCIFPKGRGLSSVVEGNLVFQALESGIAVAACHTNFDQCAMEVIQSIAQGLEVVPQGRLIEKPRGSLLKLSVFVPQLHLEEVRSAICEAGAGHIGNYDFCTFAASGKGTFRGSDNSRPFLGKPGKLELTDELRLETIFPRGLEKPVLAALFKSHPYEEVAYDLYAVEQGPEQRGLAFGLGYGFWGEFSTSKPFPEVAKGVKSLFNIEGFWLTEPVPKKVKRIGFVAGKGSSFIDAALAAGCDLFITGEAGYHSALHGARKGMAVMELGHRESERFFLATMETWMKDLDLKTKSVNVATQKIWAQGGNK